MNGNLLHHFTSSKHFICLTNQASSQDPIGFYSATTSPRGNAHLNSLTRATRVTALWPRALQLVDGIQGAALEPSLPTKNVPLRAKGPKGMDGDG